MDHGTPNTPPFLSSQAPLSTEPRAVPAGRGAAWLREGLDLFAASPGTWLGITLLFTAMVVVFSVVPFVGMFLSVAVPILLGGLMLGCDAQRRGLPLEVRYLFNGFEAPRVKPLALVGALYLAGSLVVMVPVIIAVVGTSLASGFAAAAAAGASDGAAAGLGIAAIVGIAFAVLLLMAATTVLSMALWFSPALVVFRGVAPVEAMTLSLRGAWRNLAPFVVYVLSLCAIGVVVMLPLLGAVILVGVQANANDLTPFALIALGGSTLFALICFVLLMPAMWGAMHASYRDVFGD